MSSWLNGQLVLAVVIVAVALAFFAWHLIAVTRRAGYVISESRVPRRYLLLGLVIGVGIIYVTRR